MSTVRIQVRRGVSTGAGSWFSVNPTLAAGEIGLETDTGNFKFGNNVDAWNDLPYALADTLGDYIPLSQKGVASGIASLDSSGFIPTAQLPPLAKVTVSSVADQTARLALTAEVGDIAIQTDTGASYVLQTAGASTNANWKELVGNEKVQDVIGAMLSGNTETGITVTYEDSDGTIDFVVADQFSTHTTSDLAEGTNKYYTDQRVTDLLSTTIDGKLDKSGGTMTGAITLSGAPTADLHAATKLYVDNLTAGLNFHESVTVATNTILTNDYSNGTNGVGATLTAASNGAFSGIDGYTAWVGNERILVKNQTDAKQNGIYVLSTIGDANTKWVLTRASDSDNNPSGEMKPGDFCLVLNGTVNGSFGFVNNSSANPIVIGTSDITYTPFNAAKAISAGYGLLENTPGSLSIDNFVTQNAETQTLTNKTINMTSNTVTGTLSEFNTALSDANFVTLDNTVTLTNKSVNLASNTITGTVVEFNAAVSDGNFATLTGNETLTGKTLSSANNTISVNLLNVTDVTATAAEVNVLAGITASSAELNILDGASVTTAELNILDGATLSVNELNVLDGITSSTAELNILTGVTSSAGELNILDGVTSTAAELNILDGALLDVNELNVLNGITSTTAELNILDGVTASALELNILDGATLSVTELNYVDGVTSSIQTQLNGKQATVSGVSDVEIGYLDGVTSAIQTQLNAKAPLNSPTFTGTVTLPTGTVTSGMISDGTIVNADINASAAIALSKLASGTSGQIIVANSSGVPTWVSESGDITISDTGVTAIASGVIVNADINASAAIDKTKISGTAITAGDTGTVTSTMIVDGTIVNGDINASAAIDWTKLAISSTVSSTEIGYVDGVTSAIQTQIDAKLNKSGGTMTGALTLSGAPTSELHAATKAYVDAAVEGLHVHPSVKAATTADITLATAVENGDTLDGVTLATGDRILIKNQTTKAQNGIYIVAASGAPTRATDFDSTTEIDSGDFVFVDQGTTQGNSGWVQINTPATIGTDAIEFVQFSGAGTYLAGSALTLTGNTFSIADGAITSAKIADGAIVDADVNASAAIAQSKIANLTTDLAAKAPLAGPTFTGTVVLPSTTSIGNVTSTELGYVDGVTSAIQTQLNDKAPLNSPTFTGTVTVAASGVAFTDGTQTKEGVSSRTPIIQKTAAYTLSALTERDSLIEVSSATGVTVSIPTDATLNYPIGTSIDILQTGAGQLTIAAVTPGTTTVNATPGLKLRTQWSSCTLFKRAANTWVVYGDLTA